MKKLFIVIGVSILLSVAAGYLFSETKYIFAYPDQPRREVAFEFYNKTGEEDKKAFFIIEDKFNLEKSIVVLACSIGLGLIGLGFVKK